MKKFLLPAFLVILILVYFYWPEKVIKYPEGITAPGQPKQMDLNENKSWTIDGYSFNALAEYNIKARVLSRNNFSVGKESEISPFDLALGWGTMSDQNVIDRIDISHSNRWYHWKSDELPIPARDISLNSANVHIIPMDEKIEEKFGNVYTGSLIEMKGYLVEVKNADGWHWRSSTRRDDTGGGSCELFWVENLTAFDK